MSGNQDVSNAVGGGVVDMQAEDAVCKEAKGSRPAGKKQSQQSKGIEAQLKAGQVNCRYGYQPAEKIKLLADVVDSRTAVSY